MHAIIEAFHRGAQLKRQDIFADDRLDPVTNQQDAATPSPGWIGPDYRSGGLLMVGINPGGGGDTHQRNPADDRLYGLLRAFRDARGDDRVRCLSEASLAWLDIQRTHNVWRIVQPVLQAAGTTEREAAFINLLPFRTRGDKPAPAVTLRRAGDLSVSRQIAALEPGIIVCLGNKAATALDRMADRAALPRRFDVQRTIGDSWICDAARVTLGEIMASRAGRTA